MNRKIDDQTEERLRVLLACIKTASREQGIAGEEYRADYENDDKRDAYHAAFEAAAGYERQILALFGVEK